MNPPKVLSISFYRQFSAFYYSIFRDGVGVLNTWPRYGDIIFFHFLTNLCWHFQWGLWFFWGCYGDILRFLLSQFCSLMLEYITYLGAWGLNYKLKFLVELVPWRDIRANMTKGHKFKSQPPLLVELVSWRDIRANMTRDHRFESQLPLI